MDHASGQEQRRRRRRRKASAQVGSIDFLFNITSSLLLLLQLRVPSTSERRSARQRSFAAGKNGHYPLARSLRMNYLYHKKGECSFCSSPLALRLSPQCVGLGRAGSGGVVSTKVGRSLRRSHVTYMLSPAAAWRRRPSSSPATAPPAPWLHARLSVKLRIDGGVDDGGGGADDDDDDDTAALLNLLSTSSSPFARRGLVGGHWAGTQSREACRARHPRRKKERNHGLPRSRSRSVGPVANAWIISS